MNPPTRENVKDILSELSTTVNPFINKTAKMTVLEQLKFVLALFTLIPIRFLLLLIFILVATIYTRLVMIGVTDEQLKHPLPLSRRRLLTPLKYFGRIGLWIFGIYWIDIKGNPDERARIITPNHVSFLDPLYFYTKHAGHFVAKSGVAEIPLVGHLLRAVQLVLVDRISPTSRKDTIDEILRRASYTEIPNWNQVVIFPEGTCTNGDALIGFKLGAFSSGVPVQPVVIKYPFLNFDVSFTSGISTTMLILRTMSQFVNYMKVEYLPVHIPNETEKANPRIFAENVRREMARALNITTTEHSYEDVILTGEALKRFADPKKITLVSKVLRSINEMSLDQMKAQLVNFSRMDKDHNGTVTLEEFREALGLPESPLVDELFSFLDVDESGEIDFREYLAGHALISSSLTDEEALRMAFESFDCNGDGAIDMNELLVGLQKAFPKISHSEVANLFNSIDRKQKNSITFEEFSSHVKEFPEYLSLLFTYKGLNSKSQELKKEV